MNDIVIVAAKRTPTANLLGNLSSCSAPYLGSIAHKKVIEDSGINPSEIDEVISGCVLQAGIGQAPARQAALMADIPNNIGATTINKMCGSGLKAVMLAHDQIKLDPRKIILASGMESMSNAPYLLLKARKGYRLGDGELKDHMFLDGLTDAYEAKLMGHYAEVTAKHYNFTRQEQDKFARRSLELAIHAKNNGLFNAEIAKVPLQNSEMVISDDEGPCESKLPKIERLRPAFAENGTITAANSSSISDGAASLLLTSMENAKRLNLKPLCRIVAHSSFAEEPRWFTKAPVGAIKKVLKNANLSKDDIDLFEINEAFAVVAMVCIKDLDLNIEKVNINGGACALGHPIGASGARILVTLIYNLIAKQKRLGLASLCIGGGEAVAMVIERI